MFAGVSLAQPSNKQTAILVDQIGGRPSPSRFEPRSDSNSSPGTIASIERRAFELINAERQAARLMMLDWNGDALALARLHAKSMADGGYFSHRNPNGETVDGRAAKLGIKWMAIGENIATMKGYDDPSAIAVQTWMRSAPHKRNIMNGMYNQSAIGAAVASDGTIYFAQVFLYR